MTNKPFSLYYLGTKLEKTPNQDTTRLAKTFKVPGLFFTNYLERTKPLETVPLAQFKADISLSNRFDFSLTPVIDFINQFPALKRRATLIKMLTEKSTGSATKSINTQDIIASVLKLKIEHGTFNLALNELFRNSGIESTLIRPSSDEEILLVHNPEIISDMVFLQRDQQSKFLPLPSLAFKA